MSGVRITSNTGLTRMTSARSLVKIDRPIFDGRETLKVCPEAGSAEVMPPDQLPDGANTAEVRGQDCLGRNTR